jgi:hypothetical protein
MKDVRATADYLARSGDDVLAAASMMRDEIFAETGDWLDAVERSARCFGMVGDEFDQMRARGTAAS